LNTISATSFYHASKFDPLQFKVMMKLLQWPQNKNLAALDTLRFLVQHPEAAIHYADAYENDKEDNVIAINLSILMSTNLPETTLFMVWRFFCNLFKDEKFHKILLDLFIQLMDIAESWYLDHKNIQIKVALVTLCLNFSILSVREKDYEKKKTKRLYNAKEVIKN